MLARDFGRALAVADLIVVLDGLRARERAEDFPGVDGKLVADALPTPRAGAPSRGCPGSTTPSDPACPLREGDLPRPMGVEKVDKLGRRRRREPVAPPAESRTTIGQRPDHDPHRGHGDFFAAARPGAREALSSARMNGSR